MKKNDQDIVLVTAIPIPTTRRGFLTGAALLMGAAALAGCGGGGDDNDSGGRYTGTYRTLGGANRPTVSASIDRDGLMTFWSIFPDNEVADYGQSEVDSNGNFSQDLAGFRTFGQVRGGRIEGRTEQVNGSPSDFNWVADRYNPSSFNRPNGNLQGTFDGLARISGVDVLTLLTVASDGTATVFCRFDLPNTNRIDDFFFEGTSFNRDGNVPDDGEYFLDLFGDSLALRTSGTDQVRLELTFGASVPTVGFASGQRIDLVLTRSDPFNFSRSRLAAHRAAAGTDTDPTIGLERTFKAIREGRRAR
ncbi:MAG: hypothetical protein H7Z41_07510 [Cytophagales bacterium]|nr:hypothetical protein [Armatimonadota bacterium]